MRRGALCGVAVAAVCAVGAPAAQATFPGRNGRILMTQLGSFAVPGCTGPNCGQPTATLYSFQPDGSQGRELTSSTAYNSSGVWSPDGTKIAFVQSDQNLTPPPYNLAVMGADGTNQSTLAGTYDVTTSLTSLSWFPDGKHILYLRGDGSSAGSGSLWEVDTTGVINTPVDLGKTVSKPALSPDGRSIAYVDTSSQAVHVMAFNGTNDRAIFRPPAGSPTYAIGTVGWSPDARQLIFDLIYYGCGSCTPTDTVYEIHADGSALRNIGPGGSPAWSPDGTKIIMVNTAGLYVLANRDGSNPQTTALPYYDAFDDWQALPRG